MNKSTTVPHPPWATQAMRMPEALGPQGEAAKACREHALAHISRPA
jgi:hypothetical protein